MRRAQPKLMVCLLMAMLIFVGTSSQALASLLCQNSGCPKKAATAVDPMPSKPCCPTKGKQNSGKDQGKGACCCKIQDVPVAAVEAIKIAVPSLTLELDLPKVHLIEVDSAAPISTQDIPSYTDLPPPSPPIDSSRGRAPPVA